VDGDLEAGKRWARVGSAAVDAESDESVELVGEEEGEEEEEEEEEGEGGEDGGRREDGRETGEKKVGEREQKQGRGSSRSRKRKQQTRQGTGSTSTTSKKLKTGGCGGEGCGEVLTESELKTFRGVVRSGGQQAKSKTGGAPLVYIHKEGSKSDDLKAALESGDRVVVLRARDHDAVENAPSYFIHAMKAVQKHIKRHEHGRLAKEYKAGKATTCFTAISSTKDDYRQPEGYRENGLCCAWPHCGHDEDRKRNSQCKDVNLGDYYMETIFEQVAFGSDTLVEYYDPIKGKMVRDGSYSTGPTVWSSSFTPTHMDYGHKEYVGAVGCITGHVVHEPIKEVCWCSVSCSIVMCC
jgi:hypothetical protein